MIGTRKDSNIYDVLRAKMRGRKHFGKRYKTHL